MTNRPPLENFDPRFKDFVDYIVRITHEIWEERNVDAIRRHYAENIKLHTPNGTVSGSEDVVANTLQTLQTFPDRRLLPSDVIWHRENDGTWYSSHRLASVMTHAGETLYGSPTGKTVMVNTIADCRVRNGVIFEEWLVRDQAAVFAQIGQSTEAAALRAAEKDYAAGKGKEHHELAQAVKNSSIASRPDEPNAKRYAEGVATLWSRAALGKIPELYHPACRINAPGNRSLYGHEMLHRLYFRYLGPLRDVRFSVDHLVELKEDEQPVRIAMRWRLAGVHTGNGFLGEPTGLPLHVLGISHANVSRGLVGEEWMMIDEFSLHRQNFLNRMIKER